MAILQEEIKHRYLPVKIEVYEKINGEVIEPYQVCSIQMDTMRSFSPQEMDDLGQWLMEQSKVIKKNYTSRGRKRKTL